MEKSLMWKQKGSTIFTVQGLTSNRSGERGWTITSSTWNHLSRRWTESEPALADFIHDEVTIQEKLESKGYSSPTWRLLRALQSIHGAVCVQGNQRLQRHLSSSMQEEERRISGGTVEGGRRNRQSFYGK